MLSQTHPKLPMRNKAIRREFYCNQLGFEVFGADFEGYLMLQKDQIQLHFFEFSTLNPLENSGQVYIRTQGIGGVYNELLKNNVAIHSSGNLQTKSWGQKEFAILDPDYNLLTFGESVF
jgi:catechol 2,3-dioxygenase-like lactoylglutathione lyase family enzyme